MKHTRSYFSFALFIFLVVVLVSGACRFGGEPALDATQPAAQVDLAGPGDTTAPDIKADPADEPVAPVDAPAAPTAGPVGGPGNFNLPQPGAQLDLLASYQAELTVQFIGEHNGQPHERSRHLTLSYAGPQAQTTRLEASATNETPIFILAGQVGETRFLQTASDTPCSAMNDPLETETATFGDPWSELPSVYGAELVGPETVNGFETQHYRFDQRAIRWAGGSPAQGDLWVADGGGFLVRYRLSMQVQPGVLSAGLSGEQSWQFELSPLPEDASLLPEGCAPVLTDFPVLPDASASLRMPAYLSYTTPSDAAAAAAFYRQELAAAGWIEQDAFNATAERTVLLFVRPLGEGGALDGQEVATITLRPAEGGLRVDVQVLASPVSP